MQKILAINAQFKKNKHYYTPLGKQNNSKKIVNKALKIFMFYILKILYFCLLVTLVKTIY